MGRAVLQSARDQDYLLGRAIRNREHLVELLPIVVLDGGEVDPVHRNRLPWTSGDFKEFNEASRPVVAGLSLLARHTGLAKADDEPQQVFNVVASSK